MSSRGFLALIDLVRHIRAGPRAIWVDGEKDWLESFIKLGQQPLGMSSTGPLEAASIYVVPRMLHSQSRTVVARLMSWDRAGDQTMNKRWPVRWPTMTIDYYRIPEDDLPALDRAVIRLQSAIAELPTVAPGLELNQEHPHSRAPADPVRANIRWLYLAPGVATTELTFLANNDQPNTSWLHLWGEIKVRCQKPLPADTIRETYNIDPHLYARMLFGDD